MKCLKCKFFSMCSNITKAHNGEQGKAWRSTRWSPTLVLEMGQWKNSTSIASVISTCFRSYVKQLCRLHRAGHSPTPTELQHTLPFSITCSTDPGSNCWALSLCKFQSHHKGQWDPRVSTLQDHCIQWHQVNTKVYLNRFYSYYFHYS